MIHMGFGKDNKGVIIREESLITIGNLASKAAIKGTSTVTLQDTSFRIIKTEFFVSQAGSFGADGDEVIIGLANNDLSVAEIAETFGIDGPADRNQSVEAAIAMRAVWGLVQLKESQEAATGYAKLANNGLPIEKTFRWTFTPSEGWTWFAYNPLTGALTTDAVFTIIAKHYGVWVD